MTEINSEAQIQIHLKTKQEQYAVPDVPYSVNANSTTEELNALLKALLATNLEEELSTRLEFDFLHLNEYVKGRLSDHLRDKSISYEDNIILEYVEKYPPPEPEDSLLHDDWVSAVQMCDKLILSGCYDNTVNLWNIKGEHLLTIPGHSMPVRAVAWLSLDENGGRFISASQDQTAILWQWSREKNSVECISVCKGHERGVDSLAVCPKKQRFATGSWDTMLKVWSTDLENGEEQLTASSARKRSKIDTSAVKTPIMTLQGHRECISAVQWIDCDTLLSSSWDHTMKVWDLNLEGIKSEISTNKSIFDASYSQLNRLIVTASADKNIRLYDNRTNQTSVVIRTFQGHQQWVQAVDWSQTEEYLFISGSYDNQLKLWDCRCGKAPLYDLIGHNDKILDVDWSNNKYLVSGGADNAVRIFKTTKKTS